MVGVFTDAPTTFFLPILIIFDMMSKNASLNTILCEIM